MTPNTASSHARMAHCAGHRNDLQAQGRGCKTDSPKEPNPIAVHAMANGWAVGKYIILALLSCMLLGMSQKARADINYVNNTPYCQLIAYTYSETGAWIEQYNYWDNVFVVPVGTSCVHLDGERKVSMDPNGQDTVWYAYNANSITPVPLPSATISADQTSIIVGHSVGIHANFSSASGDTLTGYNIDQPLGTPAAGQTEPSQHHRDYTFTPSAAGTYTFYAREATTYYGWATYGTVTITVGTPPSITSQPNSVTVTAPATGTFSTGTSGSTPLTYQWQKSTDSGSTWSNVTNGGSYSGATTQTLTVSSTNTGMNGNWFHCVATNSYGTNTSSAATLTVNRGTSPSIVSQPSFPGLIAQGNGFALTVGVNPLSSQPLTYQWQVSTNGGSSWQNLAYYDYGYTGSTANTLKYTNGITQAMNGYQYRVIVSNIWPPAATSSATTLNVGAPPPQEPDIPAMPPLALGSFAVLLFAAGRRYLFGKRKNS